MSLGPLVYDFYKQTNFNLIHLKWHFMDKLVSALKKVLLEVSIKKEIVLNN